MMSSEKIQELQVSAGDQIPVSVITGFLGAGKSSILNKLVRHRSFQNMAIIVNELGETGLDHILVENSSENMMLLENGCVCCALRGDLVNTLRDLFLKRIRNAVPWFDRLVIETTGLADPAPILHTLMTDPLSAARYRLDGVITLVDAVNGEQSLKSFSEARKQVAVADRLVVTKTDLLPSGAGVPESLRAALSRLNPGAPVVGRDQALSAPEQLFNAGLYDPATKTADVRGWLRDEALRGAEDDGADPHHDHHHHHPEDNIASYSLTLDRPVSWDAVQTWLQDLVSVRGEDLLRVKGIVNVAGSDRPVVIHGVQHVFHPPASLPDWPLDQESGQPDRTSHIVLIVRNIGKDVLEQSLAAQIALHPV